MNDRQESSGTAILIAFLVVGVVFTLAAVGLALFWFVGVDAGSPTLVPVHSTPIEAESVETAPAAEQDPMPEVEVVVPAEK